jgi:hypothetical protein
MSKDILRLLKQFVLFLVFVIPTYGLFIIVWGETMPGIFKKNLSFFPGGYGHLNSRIKEIPQHPNVDILVLGSSHAYRGFDTRIFEKYGYSMFNLGSSSQTPVQTQVLLHRYLELLSPKLIIYEVNPMLFNSDGIEASLDLLANDEVDRHSAEMALIQNHIKIYNTLVYSWYCDWSGKREKYQSAVSSR